METTFVNNLLIRGEHCAPQQPVQLAWLNIEDGLPRNPGGAGDETGA
jgi:hypothetical protein